MPLVTKNTIHHNSVNIYESNLYNSEDLMVSPNIAIGTKGERKTFVCEHNVAPHVEDMYRYVKARADGKIRRGVRLPKLPKFKEAE